MFASNSVRHRVFNPPAAALRRAGGFTLIELVMVIVILGVLAAVALPKFVDLSTDAQTAATQGVAGAISSAAAINYATRKMNASKGVAISDCAHAGTLLSGGWPPGYSTNTAGPVPYTIAPNASSACTVFGPKGTTATTTLIGIE